MTVSLTPAQQQAVDHFEGPLMVLAGPGSGKTRVITHRIAKLLQQGVAPSEVLALTFTNKAAREMAQRAHQLLHGVRVEVSTFHSFCARLLRRWPDEVGLKENFTIMDTSDQTALVRKIMKDLNRSTDVYEPRRVLSRISRARNNMITADQFRQALEQRIGDPLDSVVYDVFPEYERLLRQQNCVDFDALLLHVVDMLTRNAELREYLDLQYRFVMVDEYQDTNHAQYTIVQALSQHCPNLCVTGDPDQSIYGWRGARPENIVQFERDFGGTKIVALDQNFRSTASIVRCADQLISNNPRRHRESLYTENVEGDAVKLRIYDDAEVEADRIASEIAERVKSNERQFRDFAVFYRINALSRPIETALSRHQIPFQVASGFSFYERAEVRDLLGYLRLIENPSDDTAFERIVNRPARGIGAKTLQRLNAFATNNHISLLDAARRAEEVPGLTDRSRTPLHSFAALIGKLHKYSQKGRVAKLIKKLITEINYLTLWKDANEEVDQDRVANIYELVSAARLYETAHDTPDNPPSLQGFLELASLTSEADSVDESAGAVTLMTMHAAKGLEFPVVFIVGVESGLIPHERAVKNGDPAAFQEERRLLFVGVTRAMEELNLTQTRRRDFRGTRRSTISSPFVSEMILDVVSDGFGPVPQAPQRSAYSEQVEKARERYLAAKSAKSPLNGLPGLMSAADLEKKLAGMSPTKAAPQKAAPAAAATKSATLQTVMETTDRAASESAVLYEVGSKVRHPRYGRGTVVDAGSGSARATVSVLFEADDREETFVAAHCPLQPIGNTRPK
ncbi:MAG: UvrD-helicase domain-containing protein [Planctomycetaceae bacterium]